MTVFMTQYFIPKTPSTGLGFKEDKQFMSIFITNKFHLYHELVIYRIQYLQQSRAKNGPYGASVNANMEPRWPLLNSMIQDNLKGVISSPQIKSVFSLNGGDHLHMDSWVHKSAKPKEQSATKGGATLYDMWGQWPTSPGWPHLS